MTSIVASTFILTAVSANVCDMTKHMYQTDFTCCDGTGTLAYGEHVETLLSKIGGHDTCPRVHDKDSSLGKWPARSPFPNNEEDWFRDIHAMTPGKKAYAEVGDDALFRLPPGSSFCGGWQWAHPTFMFKEDYFNVKLSDFNQTNQYGYWHKGFCERVHSGDLSDIPTQYHANVTGYIGFCDYWSMVMINGKVEDSTANWEYGSKWFSSIWSSPNPTNIPGYLLNEGSLLETWAKAAMKLEHGPWAPMWVPMQGGKGFIGLATFHMMNAFNNLAFTGVTEEFANAYRNGNPFEKFLGIELKGDDATDYYEPFTGHKEPEVEIDHRTGAILPKYIANNDIAKLPFLMARDVLYKKTPVACATSFRFSQLAMNDLYKAIDHQQCVPKDEAVVKVDPIFDAIQRSLRAYSLWSDASDRGANWAIPMLNYVPFHDMYEQMYFANKCQIALGFHSIAGCEETAQALMTRECVEGYPQQILNYAIRNGVCGEGTSVSGEFCDASVTPSPPPSPPSAPPPPAGKFLLTSASPYDDTCSLPSGGDCIATGAGDINTNYGADEDCTFKTTVAVTLSFTCASCHFHVEADGCIYDYLAYNGTKICGTDYSSLDGVTIPAGATITWHSDGGVHDKGFKICAAV